MIETLKTAYMTAFSGLELIEIASLIYISSWVVKFCLFVIKKIFK